MTVVNGGSIGGGGTGNLADAATDVGLARLSYSLSGGFSPLAADLVGIDPGTGAATARRARLDEAGERVASVVMEAHRFVADAVIPRLRGLLHAHAAWVAGAASVVLVVLAPTAAARVAAVIYGAGLIALFSASALYHRWPGDPRWKPWLRRLDHSTIFVFIAASYTPVGLLVLDGTLQTVVLVSVWAGAAAGVILSLAWISAPRWLQAACYLALGWVAVIALPAARGPRRHRAVRAARRRRRALLARRGRVRDPAPEPLAAHVRLPRGLPHARDRRRGGALHRDGRLGPAERRELSAAARSGGSSGPTASSSVTHSQPSSCGERSSVTRGRDSQRARKNASSQTIRLPAQR